MKIFLKINWVLTTLLGITTGFFKVLQQEADIQLFDKIGFTPPMTTILGVVQLIAGILLIFKKTRIIGAWTIIPTFIIASTAVFANNLLVFGIVSLLFIVMTLLVLYMEKLNTQNHE